MLVSRYLHTATSLTILVCMLFLQCSLSAQMLPPYSSKAIAFIDVNVIPMNNEGIIAHQTVLIKDGRIKHIGPTDQINIPRKATRIDGEGKFLIPGLIDLHAHFYAGRKGNPQLLSMYLNQGVKKIEQYHSLGYDFVKVYNLIPEPGYRGIMDTAKKLNFPVVGHAVRSVMLEGVMASGQHLAHIEEVQYGYFSDGLDESKIPEVTQKVLDSGISVIATLIAYRTILRQMDDLESVLQSPGVAELPDTLTQNWQRDKNLYLNKFTSEDTENYLRPSFAFLQKLTKSFHDAGVPILMGTDACIPIVVPGYSAHDELQELVEAGLTPYQALSAATRKAAHFLSAQDEIGTIEEGKRADFILLDENPLAHIEHSRTIVGVMTRGQWLEH